jgi:hypothetical protein
MVMHLDGGVEVEAAYGLPPAGSDVPSKCSLTSYSFVTSIPKMIGLAPTAKQQLSPLVQHC